MSRSTDTICSQRSNLPSQYICRCCKKPRSRTYQALHPIQPGEQTQPGICSRPSCSGRQQGLYMLNPQQTPVIEHHVHHYYHRTSSGEMHFPYANRNTDQPSAPARSRYAADGINGAAELQGDSPGGHSQSSFRHHRPAIMATNPTQYDRKPVFVPSRTRQSYLGDLAAVSSTKN